MSKIEEVKNKLDTQVDEYHKKITKLQKKIQKTFSKTISELLECSELIDNISWSQYTLYFNDGDECYFNVYYDEISVNEESIYDLEWYEVNKEETSIVNAIRDTIGSTPEDIMKELFGNHVEVTVYKDGSVTVNEYEDHD